MLPKDGCAYSAKERAEILEAIRAVGSITMAAKRVGFAPTEIRAECARDEEFRNALREAQREFAEEHLEHDIFFERLTDPKCAPVLIIAALNGWLPEKYAPDRLSGGNQSGESVLAKLIKAAEAPEVKAQANNIAKGAQVDDEVVVKWLKKGHLDDELSEDTEHDEA